MIPLNAQEAQICERLNLIRFYPKDHHDVILDDIAQFAGPECRAQRLQWLVSAARAAMKAEGWRDDLRGLWCTRFKPADGVEADCSLAGHTPADIENEKLLAHREVKTIEARKIILDELA